METLPTSVEQAWDKLRNNQSFLQLIAEHVATFEANESNKVTVSFKDHPIETQVTRMGDSTNIEVKPCFLGEVVRELEAARYHMKRVPRSRESVANEMYKILFSSGNHAIVGEWFKMDHNHYYLEVANIEGDVNKRYALQVKFMGGSTGASSLLMRDGETLKDSIGGFSSLGFGETMSSLRVSIAQSILNEYDFDGYDIRSQGDWNDSGDGVFCKYIYLAEQGELPITVRFNVEFDDEGEAKACALNVQTDQTIGSPKKSPKFGLINN